MNSVTQIKIENWNIFGKLEQKYVLSYALSRKIKVVKILIFKC